MRKLLALHYIEQLNQDIKGKVVESVHFIDSDYGALLFNDQTAIVFRAVRGYENAEIEVAQLNVEDWEALQLNLCSEEEHGQAMLLLAEKKGRERLEERRKHYEALKKEFGGD